jgi:hypothetical protein
MGERRIELVEECEHGRTSKHIIHRTAKGYAPDCLGGSRRVLSGPTEQMVKAAAQAIHDYEAGPRTTRNLVRAALTAALASTTEEET